MCTHTVLFVLPAFGFDSFQVCYDTLPHQIIVESHVGWEQRVLLRKGEKCGHHKMPVFILGGICNKISMLK